MPPFLFAFHPTNEQTDEAKFRILFVPSCVNETKRWEASIFKNPLRSNYFLHNSQKKWKNQNIFYQKEKFTKMLSKLEDVKYLG